MADRKKAPGDSGSLQEDSIVTRLRGGGSEPPSGVSSYVGLLGRSSRDGYWLLYPTLDMSTSIEIAESDIVHSESLPPEQSPFGGLGGTRVFVRNGAEVTTTRTTSRTSRAGGGDEFDLDLRLTAQGPAPLFTKITFIASCEDTSCPTCNNTCGENTCLKTCQTCFTKCGQATCETCKNCLTNGQATCATCAPTCLTCQTNCEGIATCITCQTQCGQNTCNTCLTRCGQNTCNTCNTKCNQVTCKPDPQNTCGQICQHVTAFQTCDCL
jgi:hypothetical protein